MVNLDFNTFWQTYSSISEREERLRFLNSNKPLYEQATPEQKELFNKEKKDFLANIIAENAYLFEKVKK